MRVEGGGGYTTKLHQPRRALHRERNTGVPFIKQKFKLYNLVTLINSDGISNILSTPKLEKEGYHVTYTTQG